MFQYEHLPSVTWSFLPSTFALLAFILSHASNKPSETRGEGVLFSPLSNSVAIEDSHAHNTERNKNLFEKETNKAEDLSDPSLLYKGKTEGEEVLVFHFRSLPTRPSDLPQMREMSCLNDQKDNDCCTNYCVNRGRTQ
jgi:hypothetical protein